MGATVNARANDAYDGEFGREHEATSLMFAASCVGEEANTTIKILIEAEADVNAQDTEPQIRRGASEADHVSILQRNRRPAPIRQVISQTGTSGCGSRARIHRFPGQTPDAHQSHKGLDKTPCVPGWD